MAPRHWFSVSILSVALACGSVANAVTIGVETGAPWLGYMNVFELPQNGGGYLWGSAWGIPDLVAGFSGSTLTLSPNTIADPAEYWYVGGGKPGAPGNKNMEANFYVERGDLGDQTVTFSGTVLANTLVEPYTAVAFIKDFAPDYGSFFVQTVPLAPGPFSVSLDTFFEEGRHVQYGFALTGPNVWATDVGPMGNVQIAASVSVRSDFNNDTLVNGADLEIWKGAFGNAAAGDADDDQDTDGADLLIWQQEVVAPTIAAVPEPSAAMLLAVGALAFAALRRSRT